MLTTDFVIGAVPAHFMYSLISVASTTATIATGEEEEKGREGGRVNHSLDNKKQKQKQKISKSVSVFRDHFPTSEKILILLEY